jgi:galactokinase
MEPAYTPPPSSLAERFRRALDRRAPEEHAEEAVEAAQRLFSETFGEESPAAEVASGYVPFVAEHTHYFGGFGLLARLPGGVAVVARPRMGDVHLVATSMDLNLTRRLVDALRARFARAGGADIAIASTLRAGGLETMLGASATSLARALLPEQEGADAQRVASAVQEVLARPYGPAYVQASAVGAPVVLVDAGSIEAISVEPPPDLEIGVLELGEEELPDPAIFWERAALVEDSLERLREHGMEGLTSLRRLEHQDLPAALEALNGAARALVRHLVTEDRRVPRMAAALKRGDSQLLGALLLMSQASRRDDTESSTDAVDFVITAAEEVEGIYGARMAGPGYGGRVVVVGRPLILSEFLDDVAGAVARRLGSQPRVVMLQSRPLGDYSPD